MSKTKSKPQSWVVVVAVEHDGQRYEPGETLPVSDEQAAPLLAVGAIAAADPQGAGGTDGGESVAL